MATFTAPTTPIAVAPAGACCAAGGCATLPLLPLLILVPFVLAALFADVIAPYDPTAAGAGAKIFDAAVLDGGRQLRDTCSAPISGPRHPEPADLRRPHLAAGGADGTLVAGGIGTMLGHPRRLSRRLGGPGHHAPHRRLAGPAVAGLRDLSGHACVGPSMWNIVLILALVYWTRYARVMRGEVLSLREREFVRLAEIAGVSQRARDPAPHPAQRA